MNDIYDTLVRYIEDSKSKYNISYNETLYFLKEVLMNLKDEYEELGDDNNEV